jgi:Butirosin biosynthesis protein H, N-terminal/Domain of unknown function (DUF4872)
MSASEPFRHRQSAHCESGVMSALMTHGGLPMSEPMAFGLSAGLAFALIPLIKLSGMPLIAYRMPPGAIIRGVRKRLGVRMRRQTFRRPEDGMAALDRALDHGRIVGLQTSVFWLPYFPEAMRFHFNAHNLIVYGRDGNDYLVSDPVFEEPTRCDRASLMKARFAKGALASRGLMYDVERIPAEVDYRSAITAAIRTNRRLMVRTPLPFIGLRGIRRLGGSLVKLARQPRRGPDYLPRYLGHIVRMQEEIGTGGAGFRFMYAAFLRESAALLDSAGLKDASRAMTSAGDAWRLFALRASKMCKGREPMNAPLLADIVMDCADREAVAWELLR